MRRGVVIVTMAVAAVLTSLALPFLTLSRPPAAQELTEALPAPSRARAFGAAQAAAQAPVSGLDDPRVMSVIILLGVMSASAAISSGVSALLLRRRITSQHLELTAKVAELEALELRQEAVLSAMPDLIFTFDAEGRFVGFLHSGSTGFAVEPAAVIGKNMLEIFGDEALHDRLKAAIREALTGRGAQVFEYSLPVSPGDRFEARVVRLTADRALAISRDITERHRAEAVQEASLLEKEALLKEIHHRVKNNMQIVSSLLSMQSAKARDPHDQELFLDSQNRIRAMAAVHDQLYRSRDFTSIPAGEYLADLVSGLEATWTRADRWIAAAVEADGTTLELDKAVPIGLIVNELVTNSFKYAYGPGSSGTIRVALRGLEDGSVVVEVADDGQGFPEGFEAARGLGGMGYTIINALVAQLRGSVSLDSPEGRGALVRITIPPSAAQAKA